MKCPYCGNEVLHSEAHCTYCGEKNEQFIEGYQEPKPAAPQEPGMAMAVMALIFSCLGGWLGLVFSIMGLTKYKSSKPRTMCIIGIVLSAVWFVIGFMIGFLGEM